MVKQPESIRVRDPLRAHMILNNWSMKVIPGNATLEGLPDMIAGHPFYGIRHIEFKVIRNNKIKFTPAQIDDFKWMIDCKMKIWIICAESDLSESCNHLEKTRLYNKICGESNGHLMQIALASGNHRILF